MVLLWEGLLPALGRGKGRALMVLLVQDCSGATREPNQSLLPDFEVGLRDLWGNVAGPCEGLECTLTVDSRALEPPLSNFTFGPAGIALVSGAAGDTSVDSVEPSSYSSVFVH